MNFKEAFFKGQQGSNVGLPMGIGLSLIARAIRGIQRAMIYVVAAAPKGGKSTLVDAGFVIAPCLFAIENNNVYQKYIDEGLTPEQIKEQHKLSYIDLEIIYNSYEIDRISKEFDFVAHFLHHDYGMTNIKLDEGVTFEGKDVVDLSSDYLRGKLVDDKGDLILVKPTIIELIGEVYTKRIITLFGQYDSLGRLEKKGMITFLDVRENPTGIKKWLIDYASKHGTIIYDKFIGKDGKSHEKMRAYIPNNPDKIVLVVTDHLRKLVIEQGFTPKQTVDKYSEYTVELKNILKFSFVHIIHLNRSMTDINRMKHQDDMLYPNSDDVKETGNLAEDCDYMFTIFNPNDDRYNLPKHFGKAIKDRNNNLLYPNMRSIHLVENRHGPYPQHFRVNMFGTIKKFEQLIIK